VGGPPPERTRAIRAQHPARNSPGCAITEELYVTAPVKNYLNQPHGPHTGAELLCPECGSLLAIGWYPDGEATAALGPTLVCTLCWGVQPVALNGE
jgi:hypothetical protein